MSSLLDTHQRELYRNDRRDDDDDDGKDIFMAVPLVIPHESSSPCDENANVQRAINPSHHSCYKHQHFWVGSFIGALCFAVVRHQELLFVSVYNNNNENQQDDATARVFWVDSALTAFLWSVATTLLAYGLWIGFIAVVSTTKSDEDQQESDTAEEEDKRSKDRFWRGMEYPYAVGVFLGFTAASIASLCRAGVPLVFVLSIVLSSVVWTRVMAAMAECAEDGEHDEKNDKNDETGDAALRGKNLPMMMV